MLKTGNYHKVDLPGALSAQEIRQVITVRLISPELCQHKK